MKPWFDGADADTTGWLQNRGWDKLDANKAALEATKAYREASKLTGVPPEQIVRLPTKPDDADGWNKVHQRLGMPETADKYDFANVKFADGSALPDETAKEFRSLAHELKLDPARAAVLADRIAKMTDKEETKEAGEYEQTIAREKDTLSKNWGFNSASNMVVAQNAARALGVTADQITALEKIQGYAATMEMFRNIGSRIGADKWIINGSNGSNQPMTMEGAQARLNELTNDAAFRTKYWNKDPEATAEFNNLTELIARSKR